MQWLTVLEDGDDDLAIECTLEGYKDQVEKPKIDVAKLKASGYLPMPLLKILHIMQDLIQLPSHNQETPSLHCDSC